MIYQRIAGWLDTASYLRRNVDILLTFAGLSFSIRPVATSDVATTQEVKKLRETAAARPITPAVAWQIAANIANATLRMMRQHRLQSIATMDETAAIGSLTHERKACENTISTHSAVSEGGAAWAASVLPIGAAKTLVGREVSLVRANRGEESLAHG